MLCGGHVRTSVADVLVHPGQSAKFCQKLRSDWTEDRKESCRGFKKKSGLGQYGSGSVIKVYASCNQKWYAYQKKWSDHSLAGSIQSCAMGHKKLRPTLRVRLTCRPIPHLRFSGHVSRLGHTRDVSFLYMSTGPLAHTGAIIS